MWHHLLVLFLSLHFPLLSSSSSKFSWTFASFLSCVQVYLFGGFAALRTLILYRILNEPQIPFSQRSLLGNSIPINKISWNPRLHLKKNFSPFPVAFKKNLIPSDERHKNLNSQHWEWASLSSHFTLQDPLATVIAESQTKQAPSVIPWQLTLRAFAWKVRPPITAYSGRRQYTNLYISMTYSTQYQKQLFLETIILPTWSVFTYRQIIHRDLS